MWGLVILVLKDLRNFSKDLVTEGVHGCVCPMVCTIVSLIQYDKILVQTICNFD